mmetsp:Transcript_43830/g.71474  ORF Transcript_43830/g.71474 Transcript_43830/m.71474 type:complete len:113 (+) Transcript_43830:3-341(+)
MGLSGTALLSSAVDRVDWTSSGASGRRVATTINGSQRLSMSLLAAVAAAASPGHRAHVAHAAFAVSVGLARSSPGPIGPDGHSRFWLRQGAPLGTTGAIPPAAGVHCVQCLL